MTARFLLAALIVLVSEHASSQCTQYDNGCSDPAGTASTAKDKALNRSKNRHYSPTAEDIHSGITLKKIYVKGVDQDSFDTAWAVTVTGYVYDVKSGGKENCNCGVTGVNKVDAHIELLTDPTHTGASERIVAEITPHIRKSMCENGIDWSTANLKDKIVNRWVKVTGWLLFDYHHTNISAINDPAGSVYQRTAWEVHPITMIQILRRSSNGHFSKDNSVDAQTVNGELP